MSPPSSFPKKNQPLLNIESLKHPAVCVCVNPGLAKMAYHGQSAAYLSNDLILVGAVYLYRTVPPTTTVEK